VLVAMHLLVRARDVGLFPGGAMDSPITQQHLADTLGLSLDDLAADPVGLVGEAGDRIPRPARVPRARGSALPVAAPAALIHQADIGRLVEQAGLLHRPLHRVEAVHPSIEAAVPHHPHESFQAVRPERMPLAETVTRKRLATIQCYPRPSLAHAKSPLTMADCP
jgi:hypothetical protein